MKKKTKKTIKVVMEGGRALSAAGVRYVVKQRNAGLRKGMWVKVTRKAKTEEGGWGNTWPQEMNKLVGEIHRIKATHGVFGVELDGTGYSAPYFVLERVAKPKTSWAYELVSKMEFGCRATDVIRLCLALEERLAKKK